MNLDAVVVEDEDIRSVDELLAAWPEVIIPLILLFRSLT
jgi:hypothetical protein